MFPFPGKLGLKEEMATHEAASLQASTDVVRLVIIQVISELFYDLFFSYKNLDIIQDKSQLFARLEDAASARYASSMAPLQDMVMAQTEKYMLLEKETMQRQKIVSLEAMLNNIIGRSDSSPLGVPAEPHLSQPTYSPDEAITLASQNSPVITAKQKMVAAADAKVQMAEREYYPDFTITGTVADKGPEFDDMWSITTSFNVPLYYETKQREAVFEAKAKLREAQQEIVKAKLMLTATLKDNYAMAESAEKLMALYKEGLIPKTYQDFDLAMNNYMNGKGEAFSVINRLKALIDLELLYWERFTDREKAIARIETTIGIEPAEEKSSTAQESSP
jgi:outer membrane protein TolC